jgi:signal transduction histidine kinase
MSMKLKPVFAGLLAACLPVLIFASALIAFNSYGSQRAVESVALDRARQIGNDVDAHLARSTGVLEVFANSTSIRTSDWATARSRALEIVELNPDWQSVTLLDLSRGTVLFSTSTPTAPVSFTQFGEGLSRGDVGFGEIERRAGRCTCALLGIRIGGPSENLSLIVEMDPSSIQKILLKGTPEGGGVSALVDRRGYFVARSIDFSNRVGTPATVYVRNALREGPEGFYQGRTYEGLVNYTAFARSPVTGWSTHRAVSSSLITGPQRRFYITTLLAAALALTFALVIALFFFRNLQARKNAEGRLAEAQHLDALGRLTGGVAHDMNNMLAIVTGNIELAKRSKALTPSAQRQLDAAAKGAARAADLTRRMLAYARRQKLDPETIDCREIIVQICALLERTLGDHIILDWRADDCTWPVLADRSELENAIVNLAVNARDAMPDGGKIAIRAREVRSGEKIAGQKITSDSVLFSVSDTGPGIAPELIQRVTEPFFTTKDVGAGTGLGLSQVKGFAEQSGGSLNIASREGEGTIVSLILPRSNLEKSPPARPLKSKENFKFPKLKVMVIEDEHQVLETTIELLTELGLDPTPFSSPVAALAALSESNWGLILTDNQMPEMFGTDVIEKVHRSGLNIPVLLVSALPISSPEQVPHFLMKPFTSEELGSAIRQIIK